jgi:glycosyltransferase involved in cell wall biosynthesis
LIIFLIRWEIDLTYRTRIDNYRGVPVYRISAPREVNMDWRPLNPEMRPAFEDFLDRFMPDLVHIHCVQHLTASVVEVLRARSLPYIITLHDAWWISDFQFLVDTDGQVHVPSPDPLTDETNPTIDPIASLARRRVLGRILDGAETLLAVSESFADLYRAAGYPQTKAIPNGSPVVTPLAKQPNRTGRVRLGHIGGRTTHKGATLIEAVLRDNVFQHLALTLVDHARPANEVREEVWGTTPVRLIGRTPQDRIAELYAELDVLLAPSLWPESFGLVTREAQASGLWVVASNRGAIGADISEDINGFCIDVSTTAGLQAILTRIDTDPNRFLTSPPQTNCPRRNAADQSDELVCLYDSLVKV